MSTNHDAASGANHERRVTQATLRALQAQARMLALDIAGEWRRYASDMRGGMPTALPPVHPKEQRLRGILATVERMQRSLDA